MNRYRIIPLSFLILLMSAGLVERAGAQGIKGRDIEKILEAAHIVQEHFTGFALYDADEHKMIYSMNADKYFVPASNTKLFTWYTAMNMLGDSLPGLRYIVRGDSLIFWGTGDPSFMHPDLHGTRVVGFLKNSPLKLVYSSGNYQQPYWPAEHDVLSPFPVNTNTCVVYAGADGLLRTEPAFLQGWLKADRVSADPGGFYIRTALESNTLYYPAGRAVPPDFKQEIALNPSPELTVLLLQHTLGRTVGLTDMPLPESATTLYSIPSDSLYRRMLLPSDNYLAEQTVMLCASTFKGPLDVDSVHAYSLAHILNGLPARPIWVSGAGFPPNLFTPATIIALLIRIQEKKGNEQAVHQLLPNGGVTGTLGAAYKTDNGIPFVFAKTGTLQYVHNQSGYLVTRKGKRLIFSFMNNNFIRTTAEIRAEMVRVMTEIHNKF